MNHGLPVYLIHYDAPSWVQSAARTILRSDVPVELSIVSNSGPVDVEDARVLVLDENAGFAGAANFILHRWLLTDEPFVVIGSHDLHVSREALRLVIEHMLEDDGIGIASPEMPDAARGTHLGGTRHAWLSGQCLVFRRDCVEDIGGFDERFHTYTEDVDIGLRATDAGWRVAIVPGTEAHGLGSAYGSPARRSVIRWKHEVALAVKRRGALVGCRVVAFHLLTAVRHLALCLGRQDDRADNMRHATGRVKAAAAGLAISPTFCRQYDHHASLRSPTAREAP